MLLHRRSAIAYPESVVHLGLIKMNLIEVECGNGNEGKYFAKAKLRYNSTIARLLYPEAGSLIIEKDMIDGWWKSNGLSLEKIKNLPIIFGEGERKVLRKIKEMAEICPSNFPTVPDFDDRRKFYQILEQEEFWGEVTPPIDEEDWHWLWVAEEDQMSL